MIPAASERQIWIALRSYIAPIYQHINVGEGCPQLLLREQFLKRVARIAPDVQPRCTFYAPEEFAQPLRTVERIATRERHPIEHYVRPKILYKSLKHRFGEQPPGPRIPRFGVVASRAGVDTARKIDGVPQSLAIHYRLWDGLQYPKTVFFYGRHIVGRTHAAKYRQAVPSKKLMGLKTMGILFLRVILLYPTLPSRLMARSFCASTANSIGNLAKTSFA